MLFCFTMRQNVEDYSLDQVVLVLPHLQQPDVLCPTHELRLFIPEFQRHTPDLRAAAIRRRQFSRRLVVSATQPQAGIRVGVARASLMDFAANAMVTCSHVHARSTVQPWSCTIDSKRYRGLKPPTKGEHLSEQLGVELHARRFANGVEALLQLAVTQMMVDAAAAPLRGQHPPQLAAGDHLHSAHVHSVLQP